MLRSLALGLFALLLVACTSLAAEIKGKVKSIDTEKSTITLTVDDKETTYDVAKFATFAKVMGKGKKAKPEELSDGLKGVQSGDTVTITTEKKDDKEFVSKLQVEAPVKKKKN